MSKAKVFAIVVAAELVSVGIGIFTNIITGHWAWVLAVCLAILVAISTIIKLYQLNGGGGVTESGSRPRHSNRIDGDGNHVHQGDNIVKDGHSGLLTLAIVAIVAIVAVVAVGAAVFPHFIGGDDKTKGSQTIATTPAISLPAVMGPTVMPPPRVVFIHPNNLSPKVMPGANKVKIEGRVMNLPIGHTLWLLSKPFHNTSNYYVVEGNEIARTDGPWTAEDTNVGDVETDSGSGFIYMAVDADAKCADALTQLRVLKPRRVKELPETCRLLEPRTEIQFLET